VREGGKVRAVAVVLGLVAVWLLFFHGLAERDLWSSHEARAAMDAQSVLDGDRGLPRLFDGQAELQKPPLYYWLVAALAWCGGGEVGPWAVRLPAALAAVGCVLLLALLGRRFGRPRAGLAAAVILATAVHFTWLARIGRIDMPLTLTVAVAVAGFSVCQPLQADSSARQPGKADGRKTPLLFAYLALTAGVLLKGPIGLVLPAAIIGLWLLLEGELPPPWRPREWFRLVRRFGLWWGLPLVLTLALPWFVWADVRTQGELVEVFVWRHNIERGLGGGVLRGHPWWLYLPLLAIDFLPWSPLLPLAAWLCWRRGLWQQDPLARLGLAWLLAVLIVLSCASFKRSDYLLPAYPGAALFLGAVLTGKRTEDRGSRIEDRRTVLAILDPRSSVLGFGAVLAVAVVFWVVRVDWALPAQESFRDYRHFAGVVRERAPAPETVAFFRTEAHALAFHAGRPLVVLVQWEDLRAWLLRPEVRHVVMPPEAVADCAARLPGVCLREVARNTDAAGRHERPLVLLEKSDP
jgi:4-amino-4-deoxy-L-arabinose transferase-like glycosyltransferase